MSGNSIGENIKELRQTMGMTQDEFAKRINVAKSSVSSYENGSRLPSYDVLIKIAQLFRVSTDNLLGYSNKYNVDVTELTVEQRNVINTIIEAFVVYNKKNNTKNEADHLLDYLMGKKGEPED